MAVTQRIYITAFIMMCLMGYGVPAQQCGSETSIYGMMLKEHVFKKIGISNTDAPAFDCLEACNDDIRCQSFNYVISQGMCELNNRTKEARPEDFVANSDRYYYRRYKNRGKFKDAVSHFAEAHTGFHSIKRLGSSSSPTLPPPPSPIGC